MIRFIARLLPAGLKSGLRTTILYLAALAAVLLVLATMDTPGLSPLPDTVVENVRRIYADGQALGNRGDVFAIVGDSITVSTSFLYPIGEGHYSLGDYSYLQPVIDHFSRAEARDGHNSFNNVPLAAGTGWSAWAALDPTYSSASVCLPGEMPLACEYRLLRPAYALVMFGTNDSGYRTLDQFRGDLQAIVDFSVALGVIPVLSTVPNRPDIPATLADFNRAVAEIARNNLLPLWDYHAALSRLPNEGLTWDNIHPSAPANAEFQSANFTADNLQYGYVIRNLTALQILDQLWQTVTAQPA